MTWLQLYQSGIVTMGVLLLPQVMVSCLANMDLPIRVNLGRFAWALGVACMWPLFLVVWVGEWISGYTCTCYPYGGRDEHCPVHGGQ